jgi:transglutaminase-like putative cysteine protease
METLQKKLERPWESAALYVFLQIPREVNEKFYSQEVQNLNLTFSVDPSGIIFYTDEDGNNYAVFYWNEKPSNEISVAIEAAISLQLNVEVLNNTAPHPYPLNESEIPDNIKVYLRPTSNSPSNDTEISNLAKTIAGNLTDQAKIVDKIIYWVSQNIGPWPPTDCLNQSNYAIALLRALGIPARLVRGIRVYPYCPSCHKASNPEYRVQVWYPKIGWINYDPTSALYAYNPYPHGFVEFLAKADITMVPKMSNVNRFTECWDSEMVVKGSKVKVRYQVSVWP